MRFLSNVFCDTTIWCIAAVLCLILGYASFAEGTHRGIKMEVTPTGYHMMVVIDKTVSIVDDKTEQECATSERFLKARVPEAWVCCYHTQDQRRGC